jgi:hypothetical protein
MYAGHATALALPKTLQVNACGRIVEISAEGTASMTLLRRELAAKLRVSNPASVQLTDVAGKVVISDTDLSAAMQEGRLPLQAKLTVAALHEIEQKKKEGRNKEHDMVGLQWQIVIEQVAAFSNELQAMGQQLQAVHDDSRKIVQQFEEAERLRREQVMGAIKDETVEREACHKDILAKIEEMNHLLMDEKSTREVSDYQLSKQNEQTTSELNAERNRHVNEMAEMEREITALRNTVEHEMQRNGNNWKRHTESTKRQESRDQDIQTANLATLQRTSALEADAKKVREDIDNMENLLARHSRETNAQLRRQGEELVRTVREGTFGRGHELSCVAKDHETSWQSLDAALQKTREEAMKANLDLSERSKLLELRCQAIEKDNADRWDAQSGQNHAHQDRINKGATAIDSSKMEYYANEAVLRTTVTKVDELTERLRSTESKLLDKVPGGHWKAQMDTLMQMIQKQEMTIRQMERDFNVRSAVDGAKYDAARESINDTVKACFEKVGVERGAEGSSPAREYIRPIESQPSRELVRSVSPSLTRHRQGKPPLVMQLTNGQAPVDGSICSVSTIPTAKSFSATPVVRHFSGSLPTAPALQLALASPARGQPWNSQGPPSTGSR